MRKPGGAFAGWPTLSACSHRPSSPPSAGGNDKLFGGPGADLLEGNQGRDRIGAGKGKDQIWELRQPKHKDKINCGRGKTVRLKLGKINDIRGKTWPGVVKTRRC